MATPKDKLNKANEQKANTSSTKAPWQEALDRHVSIPASRSVEAAEVLRGFSGSWAATYELGMAATSENDGALGSPALQKKQNHTGRPGMPEINFRPYDWGTHRFGPKGPSLLGHPVSFEVVGPTDKTILYDWQWRLTDNTATPGTGDTLQIDFDTGTGDDLSLRTPASPAAAVDTKVQTLVGGGIPTTFSDYYGFSDVTEHHGGLYMVITSGGYPVTLTNPAFEGGVGNGTIGARGTGNREGISSKNLSAYYEIFRVVDINDATKTITLDYNKRVATYFDTHSALPIVRSVMFIRPVAARLQAVPGSGQVGKETVFAVLPPERGCLDDTLPPYAFWLQVDAACDAWNPWSDNTGFSGNGVGSGDPARYFLKPQLPIDIPIRQTELVQPDSFTSAPAPVTVDKPAIVWPILSGYTGSVNDAYDSVLNIHEVEFVGNAVTYGGISWPADPGYEWMFGPHEVYRVSNAGTNVTLNRVTEYNPDTGVPFWTPLNPTSPEYVAGANDGIRMKATWHSTIRTIWTDAHPSMEKISAARLTNLIDPSWVSGSRTLKQRTLDPSVWTQGTPDRAIFDTSTSNSGAAGSNANPGSLMDLGFRMVLFPATTLGAGRLAPDFSRPIDSREVVIDPAVTTEDQWLDIDYSSGLVTLSHTPAAGGDILPNGIIGAYQSTTAEHGLLTFNTDGLGNETIVRSVGSWVTDGFAVGQKIVITNANSPANNLTCVISQVAAGTLHVNSATTNLDPFPVTLTNDAGDATAVITTGDNQRGEVVLFASFVPYTREASQYGSGVRVTAGRTGAGSGECAPDSGSQADMFSQRRYWRLSGTNAAPQVITSGENLSIVLDSVLNSTDIPSHGYIEIIQGLDPDGPPAFKDGDNYSVSTFGYFWDNNLSGGKTVLEHCWGGGRTGVAQITVNDDTPYIAVLRRDLMLPSDGRGRVGTDYKQDVTYGFANRASAIRFQHARLKRTLDGSVIIEGLEQLAETHEALFDDILTSNVIEGFTVTNGGAGIANVAAGTVLIDGVRSEMAATSLDLSGEAPGSYYIFIEPLNSDPGCPSCTYQQGLPLADPSHVLVGLVEIAGGLITEVVQLQNKLQDINLRDTILVGAPSGGQPNFSGSHPHFEELADAVAYANEIMLYRETSGFDGTNLVGDRTLTIKVVGPTNESASKLPIVFKAGGIVIEGTVRYDGNHTIGGGGTRNQGPTVAWDSDNALFDLNGQDGLIFRNLLLEFRDTGQAAPTGLDRVAFICSGDSSHIRIENVHLVNFLETNGTAHLNMAQGFVYCWQGSQRNWVIRDCVAGVTEVGIGFAGLETAGSSVTTVTDMLIENNYLSSVWTAGDLTTVDPNRIIGLNGAFHGVGLEPEPYGGIVFATVSGGSEIHVRGNHIENFAGFGIFDNGNSNTQYRDNKFTLTGDVAIYTGASWLAYAPAASGVFITGNKAVDAHELPSSAGGAGRQDQTEIGVIAGSGYANLASPQAIHVDAGSEVIVAGNQCDTHAAGARDIDIYVASGSTLVLANNTCQEGMQVQGGIDDTVVADNVVLGDFTVHATAVVSGNTVTGLVDLDGDLSVITGNAFLGTGIVGTFGTDVVVSGNQFGTTGTLDFGVRNVVTGNWANDATALTLANNTFLSGNFMPSAATTVADAAAFIVGNRIGGLQTNVGVPKSVTLDVFGNRLGNVALTDANATHLWSTFVGNSIGDFSLSNGSSQHRLIIGQNQILGTSQVHIAGADQMVFTGNRIEGVSNIRFGDQVGGTTVTNSTITGNTFESPVASASLVPDNGVGGLDNYDFVVIVEGVSNYNTFSGNTFRGGLHVRDFCEENTFSGNTFRTEAVSGTNVSSLIEGTGNIFSNNNVSTGVTNQDNLLVVSGAGNVVNGNTFVSVGVWVTGNDNHVLGGNVSIHTNMTYALYCSGENVISSGNTLDGEVLLTAAALFNTFTNNFTRNSNGAVTTPTTTVAADGCIISQNHISGYLVLYDGAGVDADNYTIVGNYVADHIRVQGTGAGAGRGAIVGNVVDGDANGAIHGGAGAGASAAPPATGMLVVGNKTLRTGVATIFNADPGTANQLVSNVNET
jgi:hypothetical protein